VPSVGPWIVWITIAGALFGYPLLAWLDPLAIFAAAFTALHSTSLQAAGWASIGMPALLVLSVLFPTLWCVRICPLGAMQDILWAVSPFLRPRGTAARNRAMGGGPFRFGRRAVLSGAVGAAWAAATNTLRASAKRPLRPPGALHETVFTGVCIRCGNCVRVCPTRIIEPDVGQYGPAGLLAPIVHFRRNYCLEDCTRCTDVCPSGALAPLAVQDKLRAPLGFPRVDMNVCLLAEERECSACRSHCPYDAVRYVFSEATYMVEPRIDPSKCPGCGACEVACPTSPVKAIVVFPLAPNP
jgi:ferredoxin-type protein NapF